MQHEDIPAAMGARAVIAHLQQRVQVWMDGDRLFPADGAALLAALDRAFEGLAGEDASAVRAGIAAFVRRVQALIAAGALTPGEGQPPIEAAAALAASIPSAGGTGG
jgi:hypothetical protein